MKRVKLIHNPTAGDEAHDKELLLGCIENGGYHCDYFSCKEPDWKAMDEGVDIIAVAAGDGTVRKVIRQLLKQKDENIRPPIAVIPLGTANNIAKTLNITGSVDTVVQSWAHEHTRKVDIGRIKNIPDIKFFFEGLGFGIFPYLMKEMEKLGAKFATPQEELRAALKKMHVILSSYKARHCSLTVDGTDHSGKFFMVEVMNIRSVGPNMMLAPLANPGDGEFEVVLVPEAHREKFAEFVLQDLIGGEDRYQFHTLKGSEIRIQWDGVRVHADDRMLKLPKQAAIEVCNKANQLRFLVMPEMDEV